MTAPQAATAPRMAELSLDMRPILRPRNPSSIRAGGALRAFPDETLFRISLYIWRPGYRRRMAPQSRTEPQERFASVGMESAIPGNGDGSTGCYCC